ncbi:aminoacyl-tRNA hydrolase NDAI_0E04240 [Naumovozyma dairenensis CBS 421]|uniref:peptidyl-tRNA hydrolase n=1 Tax=Naumovozyma dairenensis (strain ATCC 10597 / BCRC 20456 / CBS 421 / NBRC 0211 / NRRL Y-12639) TaxID=1071378 RepID=G0WBX1_NAUDC|nr:hypothetical protein NDAI_0E04240 [Naumovozyma dairenensis CBS 421]CCD25241.1 hypothetical protein NDAI_0E04240 [Naumovozyma dairenensis CBS 421]
MMIPQYNSNIPLIFGIAAASLATGYYLGQLTPSHLSLNKNEKKAQKSLNAEDNTAINNDTKKNIKKNTLTKQSEQYDSEVSSDEDEEESEEEEIESTSLNDIPGEVRLSLVIRQDLNMTKGKIAAQCCHAALSCFRLIAMDPSKNLIIPTMTERWLRHGQAKITLKCPNEEIMDELYAKAMSLGVNASVIHDAGRTQIAAGSATVLGIGPAPRAVLDQITGDLKLY